MEKKLHKPFVILERAASNMINCLKMSLESGLVGSED